ncbi:MAG: alkaline phosphatase family protein, partial [Pirellulaceae bacterium]|nr:alkaline phosphatase family protein [Pirellulaceae bacterium]
GEARRMAQSPKVATYDLEPKMSAHDVTRFVLERLSARDCEHFILVNFANADMVGHTGNLNAAITAVQTVDRCVSRIVSATLRREGRLIITADHGNAEQMFDPQTNEPHTAHTTYDVECIVVDHRCCAPGTAGMHNPSITLRGDGRLADVLPTVLDLLRVDKPKAMTGRSLLTM